MARRKMILGDAEPVTVMRPGTSSATVTTSADGEQTGDEVFLQRRWVTVKPMGGQERPVSGQQRADARYLVRMPSDARSREIDEEMWFTRRDGTNLNIVVAQDRDGRKDEVVFECVERK